MNGLLSKLKCELESGNNECLQFIFEDHGRYCIKNLKNKFNCHIEDAEDILIDAIINFREKVLSGKITHLTNLRNYIYGTCINMYKEKIYRDSKKARHEIDIKLHLYNESTSEESSALIKISLTGFNKLGDACQKMLRYFYVYKMNMTEIAEKMEMANANVAKVSKARCFKKWREFVEIEMKNINSTR